MIAATGLRLKSMWNRRTWPIPTGRKLIIFSTPQIYQHYSGNDWLLVTEKHCVKITWSEKREDYW